MDRHLSPAETAKRFGVSIKALRLYEPRGLLAPPGRTFASVGCDLLFVRPGRYQSYDRCLAG